MENLGHLHIYNHFFYLTSDHSTSIVCKMNYLLQVMIWSTLVMLSSSTPQYSFRSYPQTSSSTFGNREYRLAYPQWMFSSMKQNYQQQNRELPYDPTGHGDEQFNFYNLREDIIL